ncbi:hypothetical protein D3C85_1806220 [compost metagenome]
MTPPRCNRIQHSIAAFHTVEPASLTLADEFRMKLITVPWINGFDEFIRVAFLIVSYSLDKHDRHS